MWTNSGKDIALDMPGSISLAWMNVESTELKKISIVEAI